MHALGMRSRDENCDAGVDMTGYQYGGVASIHTIDISGDVSIVSGEVARGTGGKCDSAQHAKWSSQTAANMRLTPMNMMDTLDTSGQHLDGTGIGARSGARSIARLADPNGHVGQDNPPYFARRKKVAGMVPRYAHYTP